MRAERSGNLGGAWAGSQQGTAPTPFLGLPGTSPRVSQLEHSGNSNAALHRASPSDPRAGTCVRPICSTSNGQTAANLYCEVGASARLTHSFPKGKLRGIIVTVQKKIKISSIIHKRSTKHGERRMQKQRIEVFQ